VEDFVRTHRRTGCRNGTPAPAPGMDGTSRSHVRLQLAAAGEQMLAALSQVHLDELARLGPALASLSEAR
jgi:hypothetical protein